MRKENSQIVRTIIHSLVVAVLIAVVLVVTGHVRWMLGFCLGAFLSLFSLFSLKVCVPALFHKGAPPYAAFMMQMVLLFKLPLYGVALYFATRMGDGAIFATFGGCGLVPVVVSVTTVARVAIESSPALRRFIGMRAAFDVAPQDAAVETGSTAQARAAGEGAV